MKERRHSAHIKVRKELSANSVTSCHKKRDNLSQVRTIGPESRGPKEDAPVSEKLRSFPVDYKSNEMSLIFWIYNSRDNKFE